MEAAEDSTSGVCFDCVPSYASHPLWWITAGPRILCPRSLLPPCCPLLFTGRLYLECPFSPVATGNSHLGFSPCFLLNALCFGDRSLDSKRRVFLPRVRQFGFDPGTASREPLGAGWRAPSNLGAPISSLFHGVPVATTHLVVVGGREVTCCLVLSL